MSIRRRLVTLAGAMALLPAAMSRVGLVNAPSARAQPPQGKSESAPKLEFEVASLRASGRPSQTSDYIAQGPKTSGGPGTGDPERLTISRTPLRVLLFRSYGVRPDQVSGPDWLDSELLDINAKIAPGTTKEQVNEMLQNLLIERFKITLHHTTKDLPAHELTVARNGSKLKEPATISDATVSAPNATQPKPGGLQVDLDPSGFPIVPEGRTGILFIRSADGLNHMTCRVCTMEELIRRIGTALSVPFGSTVSPQLMAGRVVDKTGLSGKYDFRLEYSGDPGGGERFPPAVSINGQNSDGGPESVFYRSRKAIGIEAGEDQSAGGRDGDRPYR